MAYKHHICDIPELGELLDEINGAKENIVGCLYASDSQQVIVIVEGEKDLMKEKIRNILIPEEKEYAT